MGSMCGSTIESIVELDASKWVAKAKEAVLAIQDPDAAFHVWKASWMSMNLFDLNLNLIYQALVLSTRLNLMCLAKDFASDCPVRSQS